MKRLITWCILLTSYVCNAQQWQWAKHIGSGYQFYGERAKVITDGTNVYLIGSYGGTLYLPGDTLYSNGNNDIFIAKLDAITGIGGDERLAQSQLLIYANLYAGKCNITVPDDFVNETNLVLSIYDNAGKLIQQKTLEMNDGNIKLNLEQEAKGVYNVVLSNKKKSYNGKIVFE